MTDRVGTGPAGLRALLAALLAAAAASCAETPDTVVLGATAGHAFLNGARIAWIEAEEAGTLPEALDTLMVLEGTSSSAAALRDAERLVATPGLVAVIGHSNSAASLAASQVYNAAEVVQIAPTSSAVTYSEAGPYSFRLVPPDDQQGRFLAETLMREAGDDSLRVALFYVNDDYGRGLRRAFLAAFDTTRHRVVLDLPHAESTARGEVVEHGVEALAASEATVVLWFGRPVILGRFIEGFRSVDRELRIIGSDAVSAAALTPTAPWRGVRYTDFVDPDGSDELRAFSARYRARYGTPVTGPEILSYEAMKLLLAAVRAGARSGPEIRDWLRSLGESSPPFRGIAGPIVFDEMGDVDRTYVLGVVGGGGDP